MKKDHYWKTRRGFSIFVASEKTIHYILIVNVCLLLHRTRDKGTFSYDYRDLEEENEVGEDIFLLQLVLPS